MGGLYVSVLCQYRAAARPHREKDVAHGLKRKLRLGVFAAGMAMTLSFLTSAPAEELSEEELARFQLFADCEPISLSVDYWGRNFSRSDPARGAIQAAAESRLRSARLYSEKGPTRLRVKATIRGNHYEAEVAYYKRLFDALSGETKETITWKRGSSGEFQGTLDYELYRISQLLDEFLLEYLRVNEEACAKR